MATPTHRFRYRALAIAAWAACSAACGDHPQAPDAGVLPGLADIPLVAIGGHYTTEVSVGDQTFALIVDTGSTTTAISPPLYIPGSTATNLDETTSFQYYSGGWVGSAYRDHVALPEVPRVTLDFAAIESQTIDWEADGVLGLGPADLLARHTTSYLDAAIAVGEQAEMAFRLCPEAGDMWLGGFDPAAASAEVSYTPLIPPVPATPWYEIQVDAMSLGGSDLGLTASSIGDALVDTGTPYMMLPAVAVSAITSALDASPAFQTLFPNQSLTATSFACVTAGNVTVNELDAMLPPLTLELPTGGDTFAVSLPPSSYLIPSAGVSYCLDIQICGGGPPCSVLGCVGAPPCTILGDNFLRAMLTVFDLANAQVGFAPVVGCSG